MKILLGVTGSVATGIISKTIDALEKQGHEIRVVSTERAKMFMSPADTKDLRFWSQPYSGGFEGLDPQTLYGNRNEYHPKYGWQDEDEFTYNSSFYYKKGNPIFHILLRDWADALLIAPCSANTMAKMANGICDNLLTSIFRAWDFKKPVFLAPAANTQMWLHPVTQEHIKKLSGWGVKLIYPTVKKLSCGEFGIGGIANITTIANIIGGHTWQAPIAQQYKLIPPYYPVFPHLGAFGAVRKHDIHTGCDIYCDENSPVYAVEDGTVVARGQFTGSRVGVPWYNNTRYVSIKGKSGIVVYGEIKYDKDVVAGGHVVKGELLGNVVKLLKHPPRKDIEHHSSSMLHIELLKQDSKLRYAPGWHHGEKSHPDVLDPTPYLELCSPNTIGQKNEKSAV